MKNIMIVAIIVIISIITINLVYAEEIKETTFSLTSTASTADKFGVKFKALKHININTIYAADPGGTVPTRAYILDEDRNILANSTNVTDIGTELKFVFNTPYTLIANTTYIAVVDRDGATHNFKHNEPNAVYPVTRTNVQFLAGVQGSNTAITIGAYHISAIGSTESYTLNITSPTTESPLSVISRDNISINFTLGGGITSGLSIPNVTIGGTLANIIETTGYEYIENKVNFSGNQLNWEIPNGVTEIMVEAWGGGGAGGSTPTNSNTGGGGGAGGQFARRNISVTSGQKFNISVAAVMPHSGVADTDGPRGYNTTLSNSTGDYVKAVGGAGGQRSGGGSAGGIGSNSSGIGTVVYSGGRGGNGASASGAGGGGAGTTGNGGNATTTTGGKGTAELGGDGPNGGTGNGAGDPGANFSAGGEGGRRNALGGSGAQGFMRITYVQENQVVVPQFKYIEGIGWQVNVTAPEFESGFKDLFLNTTYNSVTYNDTQVNAINYGGTGEGTSFTVSLPIGYTQINFTANNTSVINLNAGGQTPENGVIYITNTGGVGLDVYLNINELDDGFVLFTKTDNNPSGANVVTTSLLLVKDNLLTSSSQNIWLWLNWTDKTPQTIQRELNTSVQEN